jgi:hypothetical protein
MSALPERRKTESELEALRQRAAAESSPRQVFVADAHKKESPLSVGAWTLTLIVLMIPLVNLGFYIFWAISPYGNAGRRNFCRASLLLIAIGVVVVVVLGALT